MNYDIRLTLHYDYARMAGAGRHQVRIMPPTLPDFQRVVAASLVFLPAPAERSDFVDFFGSHVTAIGYRDAHDKLDVKMTARVAVHRPERGPDISPSLDGLRQEMRMLRSLAPDSPHHFLASTERAAIDPAITAYAAKSLDKGSAAAIAIDLNNRIYADFTYDGEATTVTTPAREAFELKRGVCQDFTHIMIAGLRGIGVPAGYVSGFLRTIPPPGKERLEGADAMHAWVRVWCGEKAGWLELDPTNGILASNDHIVVGYGRDYADVAPIVGIFRTSGGQKGEQSVDVIALEP